MAWEWRQGSDLRVFGEEIGHGVQVPAPPGVLEGERREELLGPGLPVRHEVLDKARVSVQLRGGAQVTRQTGAGELDHAHDDSLVFAAREAAVLEHPV